MIAIECSSPRFPRKHVSLLQGGHLARGSFPLLFAGGERMRLFLLHLQLFSCLYLTQIKQHTLGWHMRPPSRNIGQAGICLHLLDSAPGNFALHGRHNRHPCHLLTVTHGGNEGRIFLSCFALRSSPLKCWNAPWPWALRLYEVKC